MSNEQDKLIELAKKMVYLNNQLIGDQVSIILNRKPFYSAYGAAFERKKGIYDFIKQTHNELLRNGENENAQYIELAFTKEDGSPAYL